MTSTQHSSSSSFIGAMDSRTAGVNGSDVYTKPVGDSEDLLALFGSLNRTMPLDALQRLLEAAYETATFADLTVLAFHTRDILEGKGERALFYRMVWFLYQKNPMAIHKVLHHLSTYGAWLDLQKLVEHGLTNNLLGDRGDDLMVKTVVELYATQLQTDAKAPDNRSLSLAAKWVPRENKHNGWLAHQIANVMFPLVKAKLHRLKLFRQLVAGLNARLATVERHMCHDAQGAHHFADINPGKVPSRCLLLKRAAFFNEPAKKKAKNNSGEATATAAATLRFPDDADRMACRERFLAHVSKALKGEAKVHGKVLMPHEFVVKGAQLGHNDTTGWDTLQAQWNDLCDTVRARQSLGKTVVMCDFSGSMTGMPMDVSKGLGLLCAECTSPAFRDRLLTFDSTPTWHDLTRFGPTLKKRLESFSGVSQGLSTNFQAAVDLVLTRLVEAQVPVGDEPDILLVLTDMGWDAANNKESYCHKPTGGNFETHIERIKREFAAKGGWKMPTMVIWNISGKFQEYHHQSTTPGVCLVSGWSPAILKYITQGDDLIAKLQTMTPLKLMRQVLDDDRYQPIRDSLLSEQTCLWALGPDDAPPSPSMPALCGDSDSDNDNDDDDSVNVVVVDAPAAAPAPAAAAQQEDADADIKSACTCT